jgi:hypothetical protein|tara:strand:+ start:351 stop:587 length:237 start_codon:yes stop_codon:yes gene_type:complete
MKVDDFSSFERDKITGSRFGEPDFQMWSLCSRSGLRKKTAADLFHLIHACAKNDLEESKKTINSFTMVAYKSDTNWIR